MKITLLTKTASPRVGRQFEYLERATARLSVIVPVTLLIAFILLYVNTASIAETLITLLAVPFSAVGAIRLLWLLDYDLSIAV
jgi:copper/silver efflux system protein